MFHFLSGLFALCLTPSNTLFGALALGLALGAWRKTARPGHALVIVAATSLCLVSIFPIGNWLLGRLEGRIPPHADNAGPFAGIIVLGGSISERQVGGARVTQPNGNSDRLFVTARLARRYPDAAVVVSGGPADPVTGASEADLVKRYLVGMGVAETRILTERQSQDTFENARFSASLLRPARGSRWLLVTSAFHMPRAVASFRAAGFEVEAAPADWRAGRQVWRSWSATANLQALDTATREYLGLLAYRLRGRTDMLWPAP